LRPVMRTAELEFLSEERRYDTARAQSELGFVALAADAAIERVLPGFRPAPSSAPAAKRRARA
jgi:hypothetical protein